MKRLHSKKLSLSREALRSLTSAELDQAGGGSIGLTTTTVPRKTQASLCGCDTVSCPVLPPLSPLPGGAYPTK